MASADLVELEGAGHIEVTCMAHVPHGVRRLVKSVIRGLKVGGPGSVAQGAAIDASPRAC